MILLLHQLLHSTWVGTNCLDPDHLAQAIHSDRPLQPSLCIPAGPSGGSEQIACYTGIKQVSQFVKIKGWLVTCTSWNFPWQVKKQRCPLLSTPQLYKILTSEYIFFLYLKKQLKSQYLPVVSQNRTTPYSKNSNVIPRNLQESLHKGIKVQLNPTQNNPYILIFSCRFYLCNYI